MSDRRGYPTAYRRSALPQHVRQRGFQPLPMLPVAPRAPRGLSAYARFAGRIARFHPAVRALSTALDLISLAGDVVTLPGSVSYDIPGYKQNRSCGWSGQGSVFVESVSVACGTFSGAFSVNCSVDYTRPTLYLNQFETRIAQCDQGVQVGRWSQVSRWARQPGQPQYGPITVIPSPARPIRIPSPGRPRLPQPFPELLPSGVPGLDPAPIPHPLIPGRVPNPNRSPTEQSDWGNDVPPLIPAPEVPTPGVIVLPTPGNPTPEPSQQPQPETPFPSPPATTRTRERKVILAVAGVPARIVSAATETKDVIDAFWAAMPEQFQRAHKFRYGRLTRPHEKALLIWENLDELDIGAAITNLAWEQLEDMAYGRLGKLQARAARKRRAMHGFTLGPAL